MRRHIRAATGFGARVVGARPDAPRCLRVHHECMWYGSGRRQATTLFIAVVLVTAAAGCAGSHSDKAGGSASPKPVVLALATHDDDYAYGTFAAAVERVSNGSMRIRVVNNWRDSDADYEKAIVSDVRAGKVPLGIVGVRVWDTLGVPSFRALVAPFLIDSLGLEGRALASGFAPRALEAVSRRGVIGVALLPGLLRRPFGITRALVRPRDYRGATIGVRRSGVASETIAALGGVARINAPSDLSGLDGMEIDLLVISTDTIDRRSRPLTGNVVLWPKAQTIVMNRGAYARLTPGQREILRRAARAARSAELERDAHDERYLRSLLCTAGTLPVATATASDLAALRAKVAPVYRALERDPFTKAWMRQIARMRATSAARPASVQCH
jgi:TRAP-type C4-dicarboxylate transport system substrate-binding protein